MYYPVKKSTIYYPDRSPTTVRVEVLLRSSPQDIYEVLLDNENWTKWYVNMKSCVPLYAANANDYGNTKLPATGRTVIVGDLHAKEEFISLQTNKVWGFTVYETNLPFFKQMVERVVLQEMEIINAEVEVEVEGGDDDDDVKQKTTTKTTTKTMTKVIYKAGIEFTPILGRIFQPIITKAMYDSWSKSLNALDDYILERKKKKTAANNVM